MKIRPVILCGGAGTRLWPNSKNHQAKQFIDFGNWTLLSKTLERTIASIYDSPIISTNKKYPYSLEGDVGLMPNIKIF